MFGTTITTVNQLKSPHEFSILLDEKHGNELLHENHQNHYKKYCSKLRQRRVQKKESCVHEKMTEKS